MSTKARLAIAVILVNTLALLATPRTAVAATYWGCGYVACGTTDVGPRCTGCASPMAGRTSVAAAVLRPAAAVSSSGPATDGSLGEEASAAGLPLIATSEWPAGRYR